jgi:hypothetical protein
VSERILRGIEAVREDADGDAVATESLLVKDIGVQNFPALR